MPPSYRGRFAPSPTGPLHLGHVRTYLVAWLRARQQHGSIVMRIEDLDGPRVVGGAAEQIMEDMAWLGLDWDEGPFFQSQRFDRYEHALDRLAASGLAYPCSCSRKEITLASAPHGDLGPRYPGTCREGPTHPDRPCSVRFRMPDVRGLEGWVLPPKAGAGTPHATTGTDDFVVRRADGVWSYQLAVVVDDAEMGITEVVRGDDLLSSTPRQVALYHALGHAPPAFLHVPLVLAADGARLAKRDRAAAVHALRERRTPEQIIGSVAGTLGMSSAPARPEDLIPTFSVDRIPDKPHLMSKE